MAGEDNGKSNSLSQMLCELSTHIIINIREEEKIFSFKLISILIVVGRDRGGTVVRGGAHEEVEKERGGRKQACRETEYDTVYAQSRCEAQQIGCRDSDYNIA